MTPKEKAKELFDRMKGFRVKHSHSKKCAKIVVDEMLAEYPSHCPKDSWEMERYLFWEQVKLEIDNL